MTGSTRARRVLLAWETGGGGSHNARLVHLAGVLKRRGFLVDLATVRPHEITETTNSIDRLVQAPVLPRMSRTARSAGTKPVRSYSDILLYFEIDKPLVVRRQIETWRSLFDALRPDVLVADYSPVAVLAARGRVPAVAFGCGFTVPCGLDGRFPAFPPLPPSELEDELALLFSVNAALEDLGDPEVDDLPSAFVAPVNISYGFAELDPYFESRTEPRLPPVVEQCNVEPGAGREVVAFLPNHYKNDPALLRALAAVKLPIRLDDRDLDPESRKILERTGARIETKLLDADEIARNAAMMLSHGGVHSVTRGLIAGVPNLILGSTPEHLFFIHVLERLGIGVGITRRDYLPEAVDRIASNPGIAERARAMAPDFRRRLAAGNTFEMTAERISQLL